MKPLIALGFFVFINISLDAQIKGYHRTPRVYQNTFIFTAEGDLWKYDFSRGISSRMKTDQGMESDPAISPDGKQIVFTGEDIQK